MILHYRHRRQLSLPLRPVELTQRYGHDGFSVRAQRPVATLVTRLTICGEFWESRPFNWRDEPLVPSADSRNFSTPSLVRLLLFMALLDKISSASSVNHRGLVSVSFRRGATYDSEPTDSDGCFVTMPWRRPLRRISAVAAAPTRKSPEAMSNATV
jgi:hypothetical protein